MVEIPDSLRSLFSAPIEERNGTYVVEVPSSEVDREALSADETYRVAVLESPASRVIDATGDTATSFSENREPCPVGTSCRGRRIRDVTIETVGDQGDGIAKVERGYVVIVSGAQPGDEPTVKIEQVQKNVAFASIVESDP